MKRVAIRPCAFKEYSWKCLLPFRVLLVDLPLVQRCMLPHRGNGMNVHHQIWCHRWKRRFLLYSLSGGISSILVMFQKRSDWYNWRRKFCFFGWTDSEGFPFGIGTPRYLRLMLLVPKHSGAFRLNHESFWSPTVTVVKASGNSGGLKIWYLWS